MKITSEEKYELNELFTSDGYKALIKVFQTLINDHEQSVIRYDLDSGSSDTLIKLKSRLDGAYKLFNDLRAYERKIIKQSAGSVTSRSAKAS